MKGNPFKVNDVVFSTDERRCKGVVTLVVGLKVCVLWANGDCTLEPFEYLKGTKETLDIVSVLKQLGGGSNV